MQEDVVGPMKELTHERRSRYTACANCGRSLLRDEARTAPTAELMAPGTKVLEGDELCISCYEDVVKGELLPTEEDER